MNSILMTALAIILSYMTAWYLLALLTKRNDWADIAWGPGFVLPALKIATDSKWISYRSSILFLLLTLWAARLSIYIF